MRNILNKLFREKQKTFYIQLFSENRTVYDIMWMPQMSYMLIACWRNKALDTHSEYVIFTAFPRKKWFPESASLLLLYVLLISPRAISKKYTRHLSNSTSRSYT
jgi:hypothetical protein